MSETQARRDFLRWAAASALGANNALARQQPSSTPPPKKARITSSIMLGILKGTVEDKLRMVAETGIQSAEMTSEWRTWSETDAQRYVKLARSYGFGFDAIMAQTDWAHQPNSMINPDHRERFLKELRESVEWAKRFQVPQVLLMSGNEQPGLTRQAQFASLVESGKRAADMAAANDITLILENLNNKVDHKGYYLTSAREANKAVKQVDNPHFKQLFDIYHEAVQNGDPIPVIQECEPQVAVFHVADAPGRHDPGTGEMKWDDIYKAIGKTGYAGYIAMEYRSQSDDQVASLIKAVTQMRSDLNATSKPAEAS
jgi:hydroxypyruvate isomerase